jgi:hypothetical protein
MDADLSSHLLVLCAASADPWAVGWQNAGRVRGGGEQQAVPGRHACAQRLGMCDVRTPTGFHLSLSLSLLFKKLLKPLYTRKLTLWLKVTATSVFVLSRVFWSKTPVFLDERIRVFGRGGTCCPR